MIDMLYGVIGILLLALGRRLFWMFVGCVGFVAGYQLAQQYLGLQPPWVAWASALLFGIVGAFLAVFFQTLAIILGGFAAGSTAGAYLAVLMGVTFSPVISILGGVIGAILLYVLFDWALIVLSSVVGSLLVVQVLVWHPKVEMVFSLALMAAGILFQAAWFRNRKSKKD